MNDSSYSSQEYCCSPIRAGGSSFKVFWKMRGNNINLGRKKND
jgi:hypothetical protein